MKGIALVFLISILFVAYYVHNNIHTEVTYVVSEVDNKRYLVKNLPDRVKAANMLANLNIKIQKLIRHLMEKYPDDEHAILLKKNYDPNEISEGSEESSYTSYSVNKKKIVFCLRSRDGQYRLENENEVFYVCVHEISHLANKTVGHSEEFWKTFKWLLEICVEIGLYTPKNYSEIPEDYCGLQLTNNVLFPRKS